MTRSLEMFTEDMAPKLVIHRKYAKNTMTPAVLCSVCRGGNGSQFDWGNPRESPSLGKGKVRKIHMVNGFDLNRLDSTNP